jgi:hypothetical protein
MEQSNPPDRGLATIEQTGKDQESADGLNLTDLLRSYMEKFMEANPLTDELTEDYLWAALGVAKDCRLNDQQLKGFKTAVGSPTGVACIHGPPGSGKTRVVAAIAIAEARLGHELPNRRPVLVCTSTNAHVDNVLDEILATLPEGHGLEITRFKSRYSRDDSADESEKTDINSGNAKPPSPSELDLEFADESAPLTAGRNYNYNFHDTRLRKIKQWAATSGTQSPHSMADTAAAYLELMPKVKAGEGDKVERKKRRSDMEELLWLLTQHYITHTVDMLLCTNIAAADKILRAFGRFRVILQDEFPGASVTDAARPLAIFKETCELLVLVGSEKPHDDMSITKGAAEDDSLFDIFVRDPRNTDSVVALNELDDTSARLDAPTFPFIPGAAASRIRRPFNPVDTLRELNLLQSKLANAGLSEQRSFEHTMHPLDPDAFYYDAKTCELRSSHGASTQVVPAGEIPEDLKFRELAKGEEYDEAFDTITKRYNGIDGLSKDEATHPTFKGWKVTRKCNAIISFDSEARVATETAPATHGPYFGLGLKPGQVTTQPWIKLEYVMHSQHPAIALVLQEEGQTDVTCYFFSNSIQRDLEKDEVKFQIHGNNEAGRRHEHIREVADLRMSGDLVQIDVYPWGPDEVVVNDNGVQPAKAFFAGITNSRISELLELAGGNHPAEWEAMSARDKAIVFLHHSRHFSVFRYWPSGGDAPVDSLREWMRTSMWASAKHGFHWFYQLQSNISIDATYFTLKEANVPRWLAKTMIIEFDHEGKLVTMRPYKWNVFSTNDKHVCTTAEAGAFALRLAIARAAGH